MKNFIKVEVHLSSIEEAEILLAELSVTDFYAFEQYESVLTAYVEQENFVEEEFKIFLRPNTTYKCSLIEDINWNQQWESELQPVTINKFVGIRASFHKPLKNVEHEILLTPKMSFGTGHHASTFLMIRLMEQINFKNKSVIDFGTGTGILAILAERLGAASVFAIDNDDWSINNALENVQANCCKYIQVKKEDNIKSHSSVNIVVSNINRDILMANAKDFSMHLQPGSALIISGFLVEDEEEISSVFVKNNFQKKKREQEDEWLGLVFVKS